MSLKTILIAHFGPEVEITRLLRNSACATKSGQDREQIHIEGISHGHGPATPNKYLNKRWNHSSISAWTWRSGLAKLLDTSSSASAGMGDRYHVTSHPCELSLAIPLCVYAMSANVSCADNLRSGVDHPENM